MNLTSLSCQGNVPPVWPLLLRRFSLALYGWHPARLHLAEEAAAATGVALKFN
jgi:hypothetical protein